MVGFVSISRRVSPGRLSEYAWEKPIQWTRYLVKTKDIQLSMRRCPPESGASFFSESTSLNGPIPRSSYAGACIQFATYLDALVVLFGATDGLGLSCGS